MGHVIFQGLPWLTHFYDVFYPCRFHFLKRDPQFTANGNHRDIELPAQVEHPADKFAAKGLTIYFPFPGEDKVYAPSGDLGYPPSGG